MLSERERGTGKRGGSRRAGCLCLGEEGRGMDSGTLDDIIARLLDVRSGRPGKQVQLSEAEIRQLCLTSKDIFLAQPNLLELEAPIKICGNVFFSLLLRRMLLVSFFVFSLVHHLSSSHVLVSVCTERKTRDCYCNTERPRSCG